MILRRLATSIRKQDWFAVVIETLIVVMGVYLGLQANNWNEARRLEIKKTAAIERLRTEAEAIVSYFSQTSAAFETRNVARTQALRYLHSGDFEQAEAEESGITFLSVGAAPTVSPPRSVYDELISTGLFADVGDAQMREAVSDYYAEVDFLKGQTDYMRQLNLQRPDITSFDGARAVFDEDGFRQQRVEFDLERLMNETEFLDFILDGHSGQLAMATYWQEGTEKSEIMCAEIARVSGRSCAPLQDSGEAEQ